jgi:hypothetical protein
MSAAPLRFLADESCDFAIVRALRAASGLRVKLHCIKTHGVRL